MSVFMSKPPPFDWLTASAILSSFEVWLIKEKPTMSLYCCACGVQWLSGSASWASHTAGILVTVSVAMNGVTGVLEHLIPDDQVTAPGVFGKARDALMQGKLMEFVKRACNGKVA